MGGLADYARRPADIAIDAEGGQLHGLLEPLTSETVTTILGFTEVDRNGRLYNSAAVFHRGSVLGIYRKLHPAINKSVYTPGNKIPTFTIGDLSFGVLICHDSNYPELARVMASQGATALFVPTNNGLPLRKAATELRAEARETDVARAIANSVCVIRADVAGRTEKLICYGSSEIVDRKGEVVVSAAQLAPELIVADVETTRRPPPA